MPQPLSHKAPYVVMQDTRLPGLADEYNSARTAPHEEMSPMAQDAEANAKAAQSIWTDLRDYADDWDRSAPAAFAGRKDEIAALASRLGRVASHKNPAGMTTIIQGAPGVGKTALGEDLDFNS